jgi:hypothetical protein
MDRMEEMLDRHSTMMVDLEMRHHEAALRNDEAFARHNGAITRIDAMIERQVLANEIAHDEFKAGFKSLLSAQILMNGAMEKFADTSEKMGQSVEKLTQTVDKLGQRFATLEFKMEETTDKLNGLIHTVDGFIRRPNA